MKFEFKKTTKHVPTISFVEGDVSKVVEDTKGSVVLKIGVGKSEALTLRQWRNLVRKAVRVAHAHKFTEILVDANELTMGVVKESDENLGREFAENVLMADYEFRKYKSKKKSDFLGIGTVYIENASSGFKNGVKRGEIVGFWVNQARDLANTPGKDMTPTVLAKAAKDAGKGTTIKTTILEKKDVEKLGMGMVLGVDQGSVEPLKFIVMEYWGAGKTSKEKPIVLVGKGVTFDTGGINLKPREAILGMNQDMSGGAAVIAAVSAVAKLKLKKNVIALVPAVENAISGSSLRPGDVLKAMNGKTVEVLDTDAEGRLILGDALCYAEKYKPKLIVDVATLTGSAMVALGTRTSAIMTRNEELEYKVRKLGEVSGEYVWPLPLWKEYENNIKGKVADIANLGTPRQGDAINAGTFLAQFVTTDRWVHIDMAPRMETIDDDNLAKGAAGAPVRLLVRLIEEY